MQGNTLLDTDSYKASHWVQYPPGTDALVSYVASRGGVYDRTVFFGLQAVLDLAFGTPITRADVDEAAELFAAHGEPFHRDGWMGVVERHGGRIPLLVEAVPEGTVVPTGHVLMRVTSTDPQTFWVPSYFETQLLRVWYPTTVATISWHVRRDIAASLARTCDDPAGQLPFRFHDFGARGVSSRESAALGGLAHLVSFDGTDTVQALVAAKRWYGATSMPAFSIPAAEHSTITSWGREREVDAYANMIARFGKPGAVFAVVSDSYDIYDAVSRLWGSELREQVRASGATVIIRPDSGEPDAVVLECLERLDAAYGSTVNSKGFKVLRNVRVIQGDGITPNVVARILHVIERHGFSTENVAFGMGGGLLQKLDRDTQKFAMKCSAARVDGAWRDVYKDPVGDRGKSSLRGNVGLFVDSAGKFVTTTDSDAAARQLETALVPVYRDGEFLRRWTLDEVRSRARHEAR